MDYLWANRRHIIIILRHKMKTYVVIGGFLFWANNRDAGYLRRHRAHYDVTVMMFKSNYSGQGFLEQGKLERFPLHLHISSYSSSNPAHILYSASLKILTKQRRTLFWSIFSNMHMCYYFVTCTLFNLIYRSWVTGISLLQLHLNRQFNQGCRYDILWHT